MTHRKLHADEVELDDELVRALLREQAPRWADLPLVRLTSTGTDNAIFRLGDELGVRLPRIRWAVRQIATERDWLPHLAPHLPAAVPEPLLAGHPGHGYPYPWLVYRWLDGVDAMVAAVDDWCQVARDVAAFVTALQRVDATGAPAVSAFSRGGPLAPRDDNTRNVIGGLDGQIDVERAMAVWDAALAADPWTRPPVWVHGDLLPGNVLVRGNRVSGITDWSAAGVGDPACDAMFAWSLPPDARAVYRDALAIDDATWARARGWTVEQAANFIPYYKETIPDGVAASRRRLEAAIEDGTG